MRSLFTGVTNNNQNMRVIQSCLSKIIDPVDFTAPALLQPKFLLQSAWLAKLGWEEKTPGRNRSEVPKMAGRAVLSPEYQNFTRERKPQESLAHMHTFFDASDDAYAAVVYLRTVDINGQVMAQLLMEKSRWAPLRKPTIPRLELLACVIRAPITDSENKICRLSADIWYYLSCYGS
jgi:Pao retrotransposon peptidase